MTNTFDSKKYWIGRYKSGGTSGSGSYNKLAEFKADVINNFIKENQIKTVIEYGCGDGNQLKYSDYPSYIGFDISPKVIIDCKRIFSNDNTKQFKLMDEYNLETADLTLSLDVIYHLIEDRVFHKYMERLFDSSDKFVIIYSSNRDIQSEIQASHIKHRKFTDWIKKNKPKWKLIKFINNKYPYKENCKEWSCADFYIYKKTT